VAVFAAGRWAFALHQILSVPGFILPIRDRTPARKFAVKASLGLAFPGWLGHMLEGFGWVNTK
jgi:hypothetical protein